MYGAFATTSLSYMGMCIGQHAAGCSTRAHSKPLDHPILLKPFPPVLCSDAASAAKDKVEDAADWVAGKSKETERKVDRNT